MKTAKSDRQKAIKYIRLYLGVFKKGDHFHGLQMARYVKEKMGKRDVFPDTVLRYLRQLRSSGEINYRVENRKESEYIKL